MSVSSRRRRSAPLVFVLVVVAAMVVGLGLLAWWHSRDLRAIRALPAPERQAAYRSALQDLTVLCRPGHAPVFDSHCVRQAELVILFPECDAACRTLAQRQLSQAGAP